MTIFTQEGKLDIEKLAQLKSDGVANWETISLTWGNLLFISLVKDNKQFLIEQSTQQSLALELHNKREFRKYIYTKNDAWEPKERALFYEKDNNTTICHIIDEDGQYPEVMKWWYRRIKGIRNWWFDDEKSLIIRQRIFDNKYNRDENTMYDEWWWLEEIDTLNPSFIGDSFSRYGSYQRNDGRKVIAFHSYDNESTEILGEYDDAMIHGKYLIWSTQWENQTETHFVAHTGDKKYKFQTKDNKDHFDITDIEEIIQWVNGAIIITYSGEEYQVWNSVWKRIILSDVDQKQKPEYEDRNWAWFFLIRNEQWFDLIEDVLQRWSWNYTQEPLHVKCDEYLWFFGNNFLHYKRGQQDILMPYCRYSGISWDIYEKMTIAGKKPARWEEIALDSIRKIWTINRGTKSDYYFLNSGDKSYMTSISGGDLKTLDIFHKNTVKDWSLDPVLNKYYITWVAESGDVILYITSYVMGDYEWAKENDINRIVCDQIIEDNVENLRSKDSQNNILWFVCDGKTYVLAKYDYTSYAAYLSDADKKKEIDESNKKMLEKNIEDLRRFTNPDSDQWDGDLPF